MKTNLKLHWPMALAILASLTWITTAKAQDQFLLTWNATGYTYNAKGQLVATNISAQTLINKVAQDNGLNPKELAFVYRVEKLDTAVVFKSNGQFVADVYQMEDTYTGITNAANTEDYRQSLLTIEDPNNWDGPLLVMGGIFGLEQYRYNKQGELTSYSYHGTFNYTLPGEAVVFSGSFSTGARVNIVGEDAQSKLAASPPK